MIQTVLLPGFLAGHFSDASSADVLLLAGSTLFPEDVVTTCTSPSARGANLWPPSANAQGPADAAAARLISYVFVRSLARSQLETGESGRAQGPLLQSPMSFAGLWEHI